MTRTLFFDLYGDLERCPLPRAKRRQIQDMTDTMNRRFTWANGKIALELHPKKQLTYAHGGAGTFGEGKIRADSDDWSVALGIRCLRWLSRQLPEWSFVGVDDDGTYIPVRHLSIVNGELELNNLAASMEVDRMLDFATGDVGPYECACEMAQRGLLFADVLASGYVDRPEIAKVMREVPREQFEQFTLEDVAERIVFPWQTN